MPASMPAVSVYIQHAQCQSSTISQPHFQRMSETVTLDYCPRPIFEQITVDLEFANDQFR